MSRERSRTAAVAVAAGLLLPTVASPGAPAAAFADGGTTIDGYYARQGLSVPFVDAVPLVGRFDGDARDDVLWYTPGTPTSGPDDAFWFGTGNSAAPFRSVPAPPAEYALVASPVAGDFDGNGQTDIYWYGQRDGGPRDARWLRIDSTWVKSAVDGFVGGGTPYVADLNGDGLDDVVVHYDTWHGGDGVVALRWGSRTGPLEPWSFAVDAGGQLLRTPPGVTLGLADIDADSKTDIRLFPPTPSPWADWAPRWMSRGDGTFAVPSPDWTPGTAALDRVTAGDIDGDRNGDLLTHDPATGAVNALYNLGAGFYSRPDTAQLSRGTYRGVRGDFTGDAQPDVLWYGVGPARDELWLHRGRFRYDVDIVTSTVPRRSDGTNRLLLDLVRPPSSVPGPYRTIVFVHGGGWGSVPGGQRQVPTMSADPALLRAGYAIASVDYRGVEDRGPTLAQRASGTAPSFVDMVKDVKYALAWLRANGARYQLATDRIVVSGFSAGGHLAALAGLTNDHPGFQPTLPPDLAGADAYRATRIQGVIPLAGPIDATIGFRDHPWYTGAVAGLLGCAPDGQPLRLGQPPDQVDLPPCATLTLVAFDPVFYLDDADPPVLLGYNTDDPLVRYAHGQQLWNALRARPARAGRDVFPPGLTGGHGGVWLPEQTLRTFLARTIG